MSGVHITTVSYSYVYQIKLLGPLERVILSRHTPRKYEALRSNPRTDQKNHYKRAGGMVEVVECFQY
jgi:hypothetical protein